MSQRFSGKMALVVGGGWGGPDGYAIGIGAAACQTLTREGCHVAVNVRPDRHRGLGWIRTSDPSDVNRVL